MFSSSVRQSLGQLPALRRTVVSHYAVPPTSEWQGYKRVHPECRRVGASAGAQEEKTMQDRTICPAMCPMLNVQGFCESAWRRAGQVRECPYKKMRKAVSNLNTENRRKTK